MKQRQMARVLCLLISLFTAAWVNSAGTKYPLEPFDADARDLPSLQNGMKLYMNYCIGCHSLRFQRYERTANDLAIPHQVALDTVVFTGQKIGELMVNGMNPDKSKSWFGNPPPDLTMVTRVRGTDWVATYLKTFYLDEKRPFGVNNAVFENVGMPHVLLPLQGVQRKLCVNVPDVLPSGAERRDPSVPGKPILKEKCEDRLVVEENTGSMTAAEFDAAVYDLVNFMAYIAEPEKLDRHRIGIFVLLFLIILGVFTHLLNREYWKDVR